MLPTELQTEELYSVNAYGSAMVAIVYEHDVVDRRVHAFGHFAPRG